MLKAGESWLEAEVPFLDLPVIKQLDEDTLNAVSEWSFSLLRTFIDVTAIKLVSAAHQSAYDKASLELAVVAQEQGITSDAYKKQRDISRADLSAFTRMPGT